ncbi:MAG: ATP-binding protein [Cyanobacteria bacterium P01_A01_bin.84]
MLELPGYKITELLYTDTQNLVYRGIREYDSLPVIIKVMNSKYVSFGEILQSSKKHLIASNLDIQGIIQPLALETYGDGYVLVIEDRGSISLKEYIIKSTDRSRSDKTYLEDFLHTAIQLVIILDELIRQRVIHKDINPSNIQKHPKTKQVELINFSHASLLPKEIQQLQNFNINFNILEGTLAYISPEQTGTMNREIDYRSDFYSLGITFYEILSGQLPFNCDDPIELIHCHVAKAPPSLADTQKIPQVLSDIVLKLMAKNVEDRYQSASGLKYDLEKCLYQLQTTGNIECFEIASQDKSYSPKGVEGANQTKVFPKSDRTTTSKNLFPNKTQSKQVKLQKVVPQNSYQKVTHSSIKHESITNSTTTSVNLDLIAVIKATQAISGEIELKKLLSILMKVMLENAGANKAALIIKQGEKLVMSSLEDSTGTETTKEIIAVQYSGDINCSIISAPLESTQEVPISFINYVLHTGKTISIYNLNEETKFIYDRYFSREKPKSILCIPIIYQRQIKGTLYLENRLVKGAFTSDRVEILQILTTQIAISLENALLFNRLKEYSQNLEKKNTELAESNFQLEIAKNKADAANQAKSDFISNISHELRTPLNGILGYTQILKKDFNHDLYKQGIEIIHKCGEHLLTLIEDILDLSKIEAGKLELYLQPLSFTSFLQGIIDIYHHKAKEKSITFEYQLSPQLPVSVEADEKYLRQVLINLLDNAIKFTERGLVRLKIEMLDIERLDKNHQSQKSTVKIRFEVEDTGIGIPVEYLKKIFLPFEQVGEVLHKHQGTGLGLAISQEIIHLMGSSLFVTSTLGEGSKFWFDTTFNLNNISDFIIEEEENRIKENLLQQQGIFTSDLEVSRKYFQKSEIPPVHILEEINHMASVGLFFEIEVKITQLQQENQAYTSFSNEILSLNEEFEGEKIQHLLKQYLSK